MKRLLFAVFYTLGITRFAAWLNRRQVRILCYHGVTQRSVRSAQDPFGLHVRQDRFESQLDHLRRHYRIISLQEYLTARRQGRPLPHYAIVLTFDDGFRNFFTTAAPLLIKWNMPATIFIITDRTGDDQEAIPLDREWSPSDDESHLSWAEVQALKKKSHFAFGSHTCSHPTLSSLPPNQVEEELHNSYSVITSRIRENGGIPLAYPKGAYSDSVIEQARSLGYICGLTTTAGRNDLKTEPFALRRILIGDDDHKAAFAARVAGWVGWLRRSGRPG